MLGQQKTDNQYIICPVCEGSGKKKGFACSNCSGMGVGTFYQGRFFYWGLQLSKYLIGLGKLENTFNLAVNFLCYFFGLMGFISLGLWFYLVSLESPEISGFFFWQHKSVLILIFWLSILSDMFLYYRKSEENRRRKKIKPLLYREKSRRFELPNNWDDLKKEKNRNKIDVSNGFDKNATDVVNQAFLLAEKLGNKTVEPLHLFFSSLEDDDVAAIFSRLSVDVGKLIEKISEQIRAMEKGSDGTKMSSNLKEILVDAYLQAYNLGEKKVTPKNFLVSCIEKDEKLKDILYDLEIDSKKVYNVILWFVINDKLVENYRLYKRSARYKPGSNMDRAYTAVATPTLNVFGYDLTLAAKWGRLEYCAARENEIERIFQDFESGSSGVLLIGEQGVGKKTIINGIAQLMVKEDVPKFFQDKRLVELDVARLVSGATPTQAEGRMLTMIDEVGKAGNIVLFINNIENLIGITSGTEESLDLAEVLANSLEKKDIFCLASTSMENYAKYIEDKPLGNVMAKERINEPKDDQIIQIIESKIGHFEGKYKVYFSYSAIENVISLSTKYIHDKYLPEKAINILELVAVKAAKKRGEQTLITIEDIAEVISDTTGVPVTKISETEGQKLLNLEGEMHKRMIGQSEAVNMVASSLRRARTQMREGKRPIANFLFLGPTGVGKTELAKTVAEFYFGNEKNMIRLDMSEYQNADSINKMIGDATGVKGYLTEAVRKAPFSLVLLDEFEKAHPDILNLFLQVMDDGRLTDGQGRTVDFTNSIIIATSNVGALYIQEQIFAGTKIEQIKEVLINDHLNKVIRPELINRFDGIVVFEPLSIENIVDITKLMLNKTGKMLESKGMELHYEEEGVRKLAKLGYDPKFGARPLRRLLQEKVENEIANKILAGELGRRDQILIDADAKIQVIKARKI